MSEGQPDYPRPLSPDELGFERIVYEKAPPRATITFNRPEVLNAFDFRMLRELARACEDASWDDEIRVVVLTGAGRAFCVGADLKSWADDYLGNPNEYWKWFGAFKDAHDRLREIGKPTLARINGIAVGGGNELQMACDLAVMVDDAFIRHVGPEHGSVPAGGATQWLTIMVGDRRAREIVLMCEELPARKAEEWGLVNWAVPASRARREGGRGGREPRAEAPADDALREAAPELLEGPRVAPDDQPRARLARALDGHRGAAEGDRALPGEEVSLVEVERDGAIAVVLLNRPEQLNALSDELMEELVTTLTELDRDESVRAIVLGGSERAFAAGADIGELAQASAIELYYQRRIERWDAIRRLWTPLVAAVSGYCLGGGCELAMSCDLIVASESAEFGQPETGLGIIPGAGGTQRLTRAVGKALAMDVILSGRRLSAREALAAGLVARVVANEAWLEEAKGLAREIAEKGPVGTRLAKESVDRAFETTLSAGLEAERRALYLAFASEDAKEGLTAFTEKRKPEFRGPKAPLAVPSSGHTGFAGVSV